MTTIFLRSDTEQPLRDALLASGLAFEHEGELLPQGDVVILGTIYRQTGMDGDEPAYQSAITPFLDSEGGVMIPNWDVIERPNAPHRIFAGDEQ